MEVNIPKPAVFAALLRADLTTQWRNRRSFVLVLLVPVIILISWKGIIDKWWCLCLIVSITIGLVAIGLMETKHCKDRDKGIFQREEWPRIMEYQQACRN
jgi:ABC-2 type transport system permease protein